MQYFYWVIVFVLLPWKAFAALSTCDRQELRNLKYENCVSSPLKYSIRNKLYEGELARVSFGANMDTCKWRCDAIFEKVQFFLQTAEKKLIDLKDFSQQATDEQRADGATACLAKLLLKIPDSDITENIVSGVHAAEHFRAYPFSRMAKASYELKGGKIVTHYEAQYPFEGAAQSLDGKKCTGDLRLGEEYLHWDKAAELCEKAFKKDVTPEQPEFMYPANISMHIDKVGMYYLCQKTWQRPATHWKIWTYRIDMDPKWSKPVFLKFETPEQ